LIDFDSIISPKDNLAVQIHCAQSRIWWAISSWFAGREHGSL